MKALAAPCAPGTLVLAGLSVRLMAESAQRAGFGVVALDAFGDADTRAASQQWQCIAVPGSTRLDAARLLRALQGLQARPGVLGWVAGAGFESLPHVLAQGAAMLPLLGTPAPAFARLRSVNGFFDALKRLAIAHPPTQAGAPADPALWLSKDLGSSGGWQVRPAAAASRGADRGVQPYYQRHAAGVPMSALVLADGTRAWVMGHQQQLTRPLRGRPHVWCGVLGPVVPPAAAAAAVQQAIERLVPEFGLRGLVGLDYLLDGEQVAVLEVNARPPASMALYDDALMALHLQACSGLGLPKAPERSAVALLRGTEVVFAARHCSFDAAALAQLHALPHCHDVPAQAAEFGPGDPVCSVSAQADCSAAPAALRARLAERVRQVLALSRNHGPATFVAPHAGQPPRAGVLAALNTLPMETVR